MASAHRQFGLARRHLVAILGAILICAPALYGLYLLFRILIYEP